MVTAQWSYNSGTKATGDVVGTVVKGCYRVAIDKHVDFDPYANRVYLTPDRIDNWDEIEKEVREKFPVTREIPNEEKLPLDKEPSSPDTNNTNQETDFSEEGTDLKAPRYSTRTVNGWVGLDDEGEVMTGSYSSHKALKEEFGAQSVSGFSVEDERSENGKYYSLNIPPKELG